MSPLDTMLSPIRSAFFKREVAVLKREIAENGYALIRREIPHGRVAQYLSALTNIYDQYSADPSKFPEDRAPGIAIGNVGPSLFDDTGLTFSGYFSTPRLNALLTHVLGKYESLNSTFLSVSRTPEKTKQDPFQWHTDGIVQGTNDRVIVFWSPLHQCGVNAPGLALAKAGRERVIEYLRHHMPGKELPGWHSTTEWNDSEAFRDKTVREAFGEPIAPEMQPGDVLVFDNWTIHCSYVTPSMKEARSAILIRWRATNTDLL